MSNTTSNGAAAVADTRELGGGIHVAPRNWVLLLLVIVLCGVWVTGDGGGSIQRRVIEPLVPGFDAGLVKGIVLQRPDASAVATHGIERTTLTLGTGASGAAGAAGAAGADPEWTIAELSGSVAFVDRIDRLLSRIGSMTTLDLVTESADQHGKYGLTDDGALRIQLANSEAVGDAPSVDLLMAPAPNRGTWVRAVGDDRVWRVARFSPPSPSPLAWFDDSSLMPLADMAIQRMTLSGPGVDGEDVVIGAVPGGRYGSSDGKILASRPVQDLFKHLRMLYPVDVVASKEAGEPAVASPWLSISVVPQLGGHPFRIDFASPIGESPSGEGDGATAAVQSSMGTIRAGRLEGATVVTISASTVEKIAEIAAGLRVSEEKQ